jgi:hypothetical protein
MHWWFVWLSYWTACSAHRYVLRAMHGLESLRRIACSLACSPVCARMRPLLRSFFLLCFLLHSNVLFAQAAFSLPSKFLAIATGPIPLIFQSPTLKIRSLPFLAPCTFVIMTLSLGLDQERFTCSPFPCIRRVYRLILFVPGFEIIGSGCVEIEVKFILEVGTNLCLWE